MEDFNRHNKEINENLTYWQNKPILQTIYNDFYALIGAQVDRSQEGLIVELGSGIGNLKQHIPECICTDVFPNPWIDQVENAYRMSFADESVSNLILFDVFHHWNTPRRHLTSFVVCSNPTDVLSSSNPVSAHWDGSFTALFTRSL